MLGGIALWGMPARSDAVPLTRGSFFLNDHLTDSASSRNDFVSAGLNLNLEDHLFVKNRMGLSLYLPWTQQSRSGSGQGQETNRSFAPRGLMNLSGKDYTLNVTHGIVRNFDPLTGERSSRDTDIGLNMTPDKMLPLQLNYTENKSLVSSIVTKNKNWSAGSDADLGSIHLSGGYLRQENSSSQQGGLSENRSGFGEAAATWNLWRETFLHASYDFSDSRGSAKLSHTANKARTLSFLINSVPYDWLNLSGSYVGDFSDGTTSSGGRRSGFSQDETTADLTVQITPAEWCSLSAHQGRTRNEQNGELRISKLTALSISASGEIMENIDGVFNLSRSINDDSEQGRSVSTSAFITGNMILNPEITLRINSGLTKNEIPRESGVPTAGPGNYATSTHVDLWSSPTEKTTLSVNYTASATRDHPFFFGRDDQSIGGTLSLLAKKNVIYNLSVFRHFPSGGEASSSYNGSLSYRFYKGSHMTLSYEESVSPGNRNGSVSGNFVIVLPKQTSLLINYNLAGLSTEEKTTSLGVQFSKPF